ncbi:MAG: SPOR domain-containing protein [Magnetococcales bacterium]|nr:SPOR domain-containing protein [Magnetococcales bacterium]
MARTSRRMTRLVPMLVVGLLVVLNVLVQGMGFMGMGFKTPENALWPGPVMPDKQLALPDPATARVVAQPTAPAAEKPPEPKIEPKPEPKIEPKPEPKIEPKPEPKIEPKPEPKIEPKPEPKPPKPPAAPASVPGEQFMVQVGSFALNMGVDSLVEQLTRVGLTPRVETVQEKTSLNTVQVGPFARLDQAKEAEAKLKAGGITARVEESWEGYVMVLGKSLLLGHAMEELERIKALGAVPARLVKVESDLTVRKVLLGPYESKERARKMSARVAELGIASPVIKTWPLSNALP